jgi:riboflavin biosynthesis pyrimidine reductase
MDDSLTRLYPLPPQTHDLEGLYLAHDIRRLAQESEHPFVFTNFVASLDGRIAVTEDDGERMSVPGAVANPRDWRLFQELGAQSDVMIVSGRYLRDRARGEAQEVVNVDRPRFADLKAWRERHGLSPRPDMAILSRSLEFPVPEGLTDGGRQATAYTGADPDPERVAAIEAQGVQVVATGNRHGVEARSMIAHMAKQGYRVVYSVAGPQIMHLLLVGQVLARLYLTYASRILAGDTFFTMVEGPRLRPPVGFRLNTLYHDPVGLDGLGQLFASYDVVQDETPDDPGTKGA